MYALIERGPETRNLFGTRHFCKKRSLEKIGRGGESAHALVLTAILTINLII
jgi:hypothetical protein